MRILGAWQDHQRSKELSDKSARMLLGPYFGLRQRMLHFLQNFTYYMTGKLSTLVLSRRYVNSFNITFYTGNSTYSIQLTFWHRKWHLHSLVATNNAAEVIQPRDHELMTDLADAVDMDQLLALHERFLDQCLAECLLASHEVWSLIRFWVPWRGV